MRKILSIFFVLTITAFLLPQNDEATPSLLSNQIGTPEAFNPYIKTGNASWYSRYSPGVKRLTASTERFNDRDMTCAMWGVPFNTKVKVTNLNNGKFVVLRVNDRGPHVRYVKKGRIIDLTKAAFAKIDSTKRGIIPVSVEFLL